MIFNDSIYTKFDFDIFRLNENEKDIVLMETGFIDFQNTFGEDQNTFTCV